MDFAEFLQNSGVSGQDSVGDALQKISRTSAAQGLLGVPASETAGKAISRYEALASANKALLQQSQKASHLVKELMDRQRRHEENFTSRLALKDAEKDQISASLSRVEVSNKELQRKVDELSQYLAKATRTRDLAVAALSKQKQFVVGSQERYGNLVGQQQGLEAMLRTAYVKEQRLQTMLDRFQSSQKNQTACMQSLKAVTERIQSQYLEAADGLRSTEETLKQSQIDREEQGVKIRQHEATVEGQKARIQQSEAAIEEQEARIQQTRSDLEARARQVQEYESSLQDKESCIEKLKDFVHSGEARIAELELSLESGADQAQELDSKWKERLASSQKNEAALAAQVGELENSLADHQESSTTNNQQHEELILNQKKTIECNQKHMLEFIKKSKDQQESVHHMLEKIASANGELTGSLREKHTENYALKEKLRGADTALSRLRQSNEILQEALKNSASAAGNLKSGVTHAKDKWEKLVSLKNLEIESTRAQMTTANANTAMVMRRSHSVCRTLAEKIRRYNSLNSTGLQQIDSERRTAQAQQARVTAIMGAFLQGQRQRLEKLRSAISDVTQKTQAFDQIVKSNAGKDAIITEEKMRNAEAAEKLTMMQQELVRIQENTGQTLAAGQSFKRQTVHHLKEEIPKLHEIMRAANVNGGNSSRIIRQLIERLDRMAAIELRLKEYSGRQQTEIANYKEIELRSRLYARTITQLMATLRSFTKRVSGIQSQLDMQDQIIDKYRKESSDKSIAIEKHKTACTELKRQIAEATPKMMQLIVARTRECENYANDNLKLRGTTKELRALLRGSTTKLVQARDLITSQSQVNHGAAKRYSMIRLKLQAIVREDRGNQERLVVILRSFTKTVSGIQNRLSMQDRTIEQCRKEAGDESVAIEKYRTACMGMKKQISETVPRLMELVVARTKQCENSANNNSELRKAAQELKGLLHGSAKNLGRARDLIVEQSETNRNVAKKYSMMRSKLQTLITEIRSGQRRLLVTAPSLDPVRNVFVMENNRHKELVSKNSNLVRMVRELMEKLAAKNVLCARAMKVLKQARQRQIVDQGKFMHNQADLLKSTRQATTEAHKSLAKIAATAQFLRLEHAAQSSKHYRAAQNLLAQNTGIRDSKLRLQAMLVSLAQIMARKSSIAPGDGDARKLAGFSGAGFSGDPVALKKYVQRNSTVLARQRNICAELLLVVKSRKARQQKAGQICRLARLKNRRLLESLHRIDDATTALAQCSKRSQIAKTTAGMTVVQARKIRANLEQIQNLHHGINQHLEDARVVASTPALPSDVSVAALSQYCRQLLNELSDTEAELIQAYNFIRIKLREDHMDGIPKRYRSKEVAATFRDELTWLQRLQSSPKMGVNSVLEDDAQTLGAKGDTGGPRSPKVDYNVYRPDRPKQQKDKTKSKCYLIN